VFGLKAETDVLRESKHNCLWLMAVADNPVGAQASRPSPGIGVLVNVCESVRSGRVIPVAVASTSFFLHVKIVQSIQVPRGISKGTGGGGGGSRCIGCGSASERRAPARIPIHVAKKVCLASTLPPERMYPSQTPIMVAYGWVEAHV
jgi:hypothetical protein